MLTEETYNLVVKNEADEDMNKVLLFTKKDKVAPIFKSLTAMYRDRLRFVIVPILDKDPSEDNIKLQKKYGVESMPMVVVE